MTAPVCRLRHCRPKVRRRVVLVDRAPQVAAFVPAERPDLAQRKERAARRRAELMPQASRMEAQFITARSA